MKIRQPQEGKAEPGGRAEGPLSGRRETRNSVAGTDRGARPFDQAVQDIEIRALLEEMDEAGVEQAVVPIRKGCGGDNKDLVHLLERHMQDREQSAAAFTAFLKRLEGYKEALRTAVEAGDERA